MNQEVDMAISAVADDGFDRRVDRFEQADRLRIERTRRRDRMLDLTDHERYEADWPPAGRGSRDQELPSRQRWPFARR
jgi:hypothetical protein